MFLSLIFKMLLNMKFAKIIFPLFLLFTLPACQKEDAEPGDPADPPTLSGAFTAARSGVFQKQNGYNAEGTAQLGADEANAQWLRLAPDFNASLSTGAVTVYLSQNQNLALGAAGTFQRVELVTKPGEHFYKIDPAVGDDFRFAILWCASASVQFGNAELK